MHFIIKVALSTIFGLVAITPLLGQEEEPLTAIDFERGTVTGAEISDVELLDSLRDIAASNARQKIRNGFKGFSKFLRSFEQAKSDEKRFYSLELTEEQENLISDLSKEFSSKLKTIELSEMSEQDKIARQKQLEQDYLNKLAENFVPFQLKEFENWNSFVGLPKMLTGSGYGNSIGLTSTQNSRIREKSKKLVSDIAEATQEFKLRAAKLVYDELTESQRDLLADKLNLKVVNDLAEHLTLKQIVQLHHLDAESLDDVFFSGGGRSPNHSLRVWNEKSRKSD
jgi:hypothetical protein